MNCEMCKEWGETVDEAERLFHPGHYVQCSTCLRWTYPNLGVNMPAGMSVCIGSTAAFEKARQMGRSEEVWYHIMNGQARLSAAGRPKPDKFDKMEVLERGRRQREESQGHLGYGPGIRNLGGELPAIVETPVRELSGARIRQTRGV